MKFFVLVLLLASNVVFAGDLSLLRARSSAEGWTFKIGQTSVIDSPVDWVTGYVPRETPRESLFDAGVLKELPAKYDVRDVMVANWPVKNQGQCGSCWAFGTTGVLEGLLLIRDHKYTALSEQEILSCSGQGTCGGGYFAHEYQREPGQSFETEFPYRASDVQCKAGLGHEEKLATWGYVGDGRRAPSVVQLKTALLKYGPLAVTVAADYPMQAYRSGVFNACTGEYTNHLVTLTGWDDSTKSFTFKNSWGTNWGEKGFMRIKFNCSRIGETASFAVLK